MSHLILGATSGFNSAATFFVKFSYSEHRLRLIIVANPMSFNMYASYFITFYVRCQFGSHHQYGILLGVFLCLLSVRKV